MSTYIEPLGDAGIPMSPYEERVWEVLKEHWKRRSNRRGLPDWMSITLERTGDFAGNAAIRVTDAGPAIVKKSIRDAGIEVVNKAA